MNIVVQIEMEILYSILLTVLNRQIMEGKNANANAALSMYQRKCAWCIIHICMHAQCACYEW